MTTPHPNADLLRAIADGKQLQEEVINNAGRRFVDCSDGRALTLIAKDCARFVRIKTEFPIRGSLHEHQFIGASLRDYFAAKAMQGFVSSYPEGNVTSSFEDIAGDAYDMADAIREGQGKG